jgi:hypothetical protein
MYQSSYIYIDGLKLAGISTKEGGGEVVVLAIV